MSKFKPALRTLELWAFVVGASAFPVGLLAYLGLMPSALIEGPLFVAFLSVFVVWGASILLIMEFNRATKRQTLWWLSSGFSFAELRTMVSWCPKELLVFCLALSAISFVTALPLGRVSWRPDEPLSARSALGLCSGVSLFCGLALPIIASAARMPGTFQAQQAVAADRPKKGSG